MSDLAHRGTTTNMDAEVDSPAIFDVPLGRVGRLTHARLSWVGDVVTRLELTVDVERRRFDTLEAAESFGNRRETRSANLRGGFDHDAPVEVALWLDDAALLTHFGEPSIEARRRALVALLAALAEGRSTPLTQPRVWRFESAVQPVAGRPFAAGYRNTTLPA